MLTRGAACVMYDLDGGCGLAGAAAGCFIGSCSPNRATAMYGGAGKGGAIQCFHMPNIYRDILTSTSVTEQ